MHELAETYYREKHFVFDGRNMFRMSTILAYSEGMGGV